MYANTFAKISHFLLRYNHDYALITIYAIIMTLVHRRRRTSNCCEVAASHTRVVTNCCSAASEVVVEFVGKGESSSRLRWACRHPNIWDGYIADRKIFCLDPKKYVGRIRRSHVVRAARLPCNSNFVYPRGTLTELLKVLNKAHPGGEKTRPLARSEISFCALIGS